MAEKEPISSTSKDYGATAAVPSVGFADFSPTELYNLSEGIADNISTINTGLKTLEKMWKQIGGPKDSLDLRDKIHEMQQKVNGSVSATARDLQRLGVVVRRGDKQQKLQVDRLTQAFGDALVYYGTVCKDDDQLFDDALTEALHVDSGSEVDEEENLTREELQQILQDDEGEEGAEEVTPSEGERDNIWDDDFTSFRGEKSAFYEEAGPKIEGTDPLHLFSQIWDQPIMDMIVDETNKYAQHTIDTAVEANTLAPNSRLNAWEHTSAEEVYTLMAIMILMGICVRSRIDEYWTTGILGMQKFRSLMSLQRFWLLMKFLHFADNDYLLPTTRGEERKLYKIKSVLEYLNSKFQAIYTPRKELSIDESLLLWKGRLSWVQCIRSKAARFGIKTYELCEAVTGYCLKTIIYTGKSASTQPLFGFTNSTAKIVLTLMQGYLGKGYTLFMDNFYNSVSLAKFLKSKMTDGDVVGTLNRRCVDTPQVIKVIDEKRVPRPGPSGKCSLW